MTDHYQPAHPEEEAKKLPDTLSALVRLALHDLETVERNEKIRINMLAFISPIRHDLAAMYESTVDKDYYSKCGVGLAGAVMVNTLNAPLDMYCDTANWGNEALNKFYFLDQIRHGDVRLALNEILGYDAGHDMTVRILPYFNRNRCSQHSKSNRLYKNAELKVYMPTYEKDAAGFKDGLRFIIDSLEKAGF